MTYMLTIVQFIGRTYYQTYYYKHHCADVMSILSKDNVATFDIFNELFKFTNMVFNADHLNHCKSLHMKYSDMSLAFASMIQQYLSSFEGQFTINSTVIMAAVGMINYGPRFIVDVATDRLFEAFTRHTGLLQGFAVHVADGSEPAAAPQPVPAKSRSRTTRPRSKATQQEDVPSQGNSASSVSS